MVNRTNNPVESFNNKLNSFFQSGKRPSMVSFVQTICKISEGALLDFQNVKKKRASNRRAHKDPTFFQIPADYATFVPKK